MSRQDRFGICRLAIELGTGAEACRAAASRSGLLMPVDSAREADALVTDQPDALAHELPVLWLGSGLQDFPARVFPAFPWRFDPRVGAIHASLHAGQLGRPVLLRLHCWSARSVSRGDAMKLAAADVALWLFGEEPAAAFGIRHSSGLEVLHLGFSNGGMALLDFADTLPDGDDYRSLSLIGSRGAAYADDHRDRNLCFGGGAPRALAPEIGDCHWQPMLEDFAAAVRAGRDSTAAARDHSNAAAALQRARLSNT